MTTTGAPDAGWYPDPAGQGQRYWDGSGWTTQVRTNQVIPPSVVQPARPSGQVPVVQAGRKPRERKTRSGPAPQWGLIGAVVAALLLLISLFLPWGSAEATLDGVPTSSSGNAFDADLGWVGTGASLADYEAAVLGDVESRGVFAHGWLYLAVALIILAAIAFQQADPAPLTVLGAMTVLLTILNIMSFRALDRDLMTTSGVASLIDLSMAIGPWLALFAGLIVTVSGAYQIFRQA